MNIDPSLQVAICTSLELLVNKALQLDPGTRYSLASQQGKVLAVEIVRPSLTVYLIPDTDELRLQSTYDGEITTRLKGSPLALLSLLNSERVNLANSGVEVFGNTGFLIELQTLLQNLDIDWEEAISQVVGDVLGPSISESLRGVKRWFGERKSSAERLIGEFLTEEVRATPSDVELQQFYQRVDRLRLGLDRAAANLQILGQNSNPTAPVKGQDKGVTQ